MAPITEKPIFLATHPRSCSTAFERVFMTRKDDLNCIHEPFGDAFYYGPERLSSRYEGEDEKSLKGREDSGFSNSTFKSVLDDFEKEKGKGKRLFIKDMAQYLVPPDDHSTHNNAKLAPSVSAYSTSQTRSKNPSVIPIELLKDFHFTFLIRNPRRAIPSYYRCCIPPLNQQTGFEYFMPNEAGYRELRELFDFLKDERVIKSSKSQQNGVSNGYSSDSYDICVIDADDLLDHPKEVIQKFCESVGLEFKESMLEWGAGEGCESFDKWKGFHEDAIGSSGLKPRTVHKKPKTREQEIAEWTEKYGEEAAKVIDRTAEENMKDYEYLKNFKINISID